MVFLGKMLYLHSACLSPPRSILMGTGRLTEKPDEMPRGNLGMDWLPIQGEVLNTPSCFIGQKLE